MSVGSVAGGQDVIVKFWVYCITMSIQVVVSYVKLYSLNLYSTLLFSAHSETHIDLNLSETLRVFPTCTSNSISLYQLPIAITFPYRDRHTFRPDPPNIPHLAYFSDTVSHIQIQKHQNSQATHTQHPPTMYCSDSDKQQDAYRYNPW